jgi:hypothetical protein
LGQPGEASPAYRTEQSYLVWIERFARHKGTDDLRAKGGPEISEFLDSLALNERLSASSQRQALNALVFLYREVFEKDLGDFSDCLVMPKSRRPRFTRTSCKSLDWVCAARWMANWTTILNPKKSPA